MQSVTNDLYDELYGDTAVYLDVEDVAQSLGTDCNVQSISAIFGFTYANVFADLVLHVIIACEKSVGINLETNGLCAFIDSHVHNNNGAIIVVADCPSKLVSAYSSILLEQNLVLNIGTFTWIQYNHE